MSFYLVLKHDLLELVQNFSVVMEICYQTSSFPEGEGHLTAT